RIEMEVENNNSNYKDGLTAEIFIPVKEINGHLIPPSSLTLNEEGQVGVRHIVNKNIAQFSKVEILGDEDEYVWIAGLPEKVTIITVGHEFVSSGDFVNYKLQDESS
ncbi:MAG: efflux RND transporter periplasmic adaptor subunit, partial [Pseudomonadota bacterium]|nr:efflux RND transporter periplasmic adaptor subunit [Pseudomonadota bacterium]